MHLKTNLIILALFAFISFSPQQGQAETSVEEAQISFVNPSQNGPFKGLRMKMKEKRERRVARRADRRMKRQYKGKHLGQKKV